MEQKKGLTSATIKLIAIICMFIDHAAASVYQALLYGGRLHFGQNGIDPQLMYNLGIGDISDNATLIYIILRAIGRLSFPIYCFFIIEGFKYTRSKGKYLLRLAIFALISEVPFDMAIFGYCIYPFYQNVFFTLAIGLAMIMGIDALTNRELRLAARVWLRIAVIFFLPFAFLELFTNYGFEIAMAFGLTPSKPEDVYMTLAIMYGIAVVLAVMCVIVFSTIVRGKAGMNVIVILAFFGAACFISDQSTIVGAQTDYGAMGILTILVIYLLRFYKMPSFLAGCGVLTVFSISELPCFLAVPLIKNYNGERGKGNKYFFYAFYPAHLLLLGLILFFIMKRTPNGAVITSVAKRIIPSISSMF